MTMLFSTIRLIKCLIIYICGAGFGFFAGLSLSNKNFNFLIISLPFLLIGTFLYFLGVQKTHIKN